MKIGVCVKLYPGDYIRFGDEKFAKIKSHGFDCVDYDMANTEKGIYLLTDSELEAFLQKERANAEKAGIEISQVHGPWRSPRDLLEEDRQERFEKMSKSIRATAKLGCPYWVIHPLMPYTIRDIGTGHEQDTWDINLNFFTRLAAVAEECNVTICLENMPFPLFSIATPQKLQQLVQQIGHPNVQMCLDTGHVSIFPELSVGDCIRQIAPNLRVLHVHDNDGTKDQHLWPKAGIIHWPDFTAALKDIQFQGVLSLEVSPEETLSDEEFERDSRTLATLARSLTP